MDYIFKKYDDNLDEEKLSKVPTKTLQMVVDSCDRTGEGLCEVCRFYQYVIAKRKS